MPRPLILRYHIRAATGHDLDQPFVDEHAHRLAGSQSCDPVRLDERGLRRHRPARPQLTRINPVTQDRRDLQVDRRLALMINRHALQDSQPLRTQDKATGP